MAGLGRYCYLPASKYWDPNAALGYSENYTDACVQAHAYGARTAPMLVVDTEANNAPLHITHGSLFDIPGYRPETRA